MKYSVVILDGAAGEPLPQRGGKTCLELACTPNLDALAKEGVVGLARTVPAGMEPSSACACMSVLGYDPKVYYKGRSAIEAVSLDIPVAEDDVLFRCNLVGVEDGKMRSYSAGYITSQESQELISALNDSLGSDEVKFYPGVGYRNILKLKGRADSLKAVCTPPHDIPDKAVNEYLPAGEGSDVLRDLMQRSERVLRTHPINIARAARGDVPATTIWLFWGSGRLAAMPSFKEVYGLKAALTSGVDLLKGLAEMMGIKVLDIPGVSDGPDNDYAAQAGGALKALDDNDLVVIHIEAPDEAAHAGAIDDKIEAIERIDKEVISRLRAYAKDDLRLLAMPDHPTPIAIRTHSPEPPPFLLWGKGFKPNGAKVYSEAAAKGTGVVMPDGYKIMGKFLGD
ncbi:MAG: cofactor-independent phosphoglycerate mutase [Dehalococcoidia bacterium]|jgi:2,3-bisphosphoglycerate-independent phosphoglycerate mutase